MEITIEDMARLNEEVKAFSETHEGWAERRGFPWEALDGTAQACAMGVFHNLFEAVENEIREQTEQGNTSGMAVAGVNGEGLESLITQACRTAFILGFESAKQYAGDMSQRKEKE